MATLPLDPSIVVRNEQIGRPLGSTPVVDPGLAGTIHLGRNEAVANLLPGEQGTIRATVDFAVPSIDAETFTGLRSAIASIIGPGAEHGLARSVGIANEPPPIPASRMAEWAEALLQRHVAGSAQSRTASTWSFSTSACPNATCRSIVGALRRLPTVVLRFHGVLEVRATTGGQNTATATIPVTVVDFDDGYVVPFAGYSENLSLGLASPTDATASADGWRVA